MPGLEPLPAAPRGVPAGLEFVLDLLRRPPTCVPGRLVGRVDHGGQVPIGVGQRHVGIDREDTEWSQGKPRHRLGRVGEHGGDRVEERQPFEGVDARGQGRPVDRRTQRALDFGEQRVVGMAFGNQSLGGAGGAGEQSHRHQSGDERAWRVGDLVAEAEERVDVVPGPGDVALPEAEHRSGEQDIGKRTESPFHGERE